MGRLSHVPVTLVCGPPGAGKSTYVREHKADTDLVLDVDELFKALTLMEMRQKPEALVPFVLAARDGVIDLIAKGFLGPRHAWIITCGHNNNARVELSERLNARVVVVSAPAGECRARMTKQGRPDWHVREMTAVAEEWHARFRPQPGEAIEYAEGAGRQVGADGWPLAPY